MRPTSITALERNAELPDSASTYGLEAGGTGGYIAVYLASCFVYFSIVLSLAEMASMYVRNIRFNRYYC